jgi:hypothetical protein
VGYISSNSSVSSFKRLAVRALQMIPPHRLGYINIASTRKPIRKITLNNNCLVHLECMWVPKRRFDSVRWLTTFYSWCKAKHHQHRYVEIISCNYVLIPTILSLAIILWGFLLFNRDIVVSCSIIEGMTWVGISRTT